MRIPGMRADVSVAEACETLAQVFRQSGIDDPAIDARILVAHALSLTRAQLLSQADRELDAREVNAISARAARRLKREPVSRILGSREFWGLKLDITPAVLDPRPDTETVVEASLEWITTRGLRQEAIRVLDIGTGSGALLLALLSELPNAVGVGTDISTDALAVARINAHRHDLASRCHFVCCDLAHAVRGPCELIVSNPPYIVSDQIDGLAPEVRDHDPRIALDGGADGLEAYRAIARDGRRLLAERGRLIVELGQGQADAVQGIFTQAGLAIAGEPRRDVSGIKRALSASTP